MIVGGNKGRNGGKDERKEQSEGGWERTWGRKKEEGTATNRIKVSCMLLALFPPALIPQADNELNRHSLL